MEIREAIGLLGLVNVRQLGGRSLLHDDGDPVWELLPDLLNLFLSLL
jgi:hypothetical protein